MPILLRWLLLIALLLPFSARAQQGQVSLPNGEYTLSTTDLSVKVLGGSVAVQRTWVNGRWYINPMWADLKFKLDSADGSVQYVDRTGSVYERAGNLSDVYLFDSNQTIRKTAAGWRWSDRGGNTVDYDAAGRISGYGNRNGVQVHFVRNAEHQITQVLDHFNRLALQFAYIDGKLTEARDRSSPARVVQYHWTGDELRRVTDVLQHEWTYVYDTSTGQLKKVTDPEQRSTEITYVRAFSVGAISAPLGISFSGKPGRDFRISRVASLKDPRGHSTGYQYEYDRQNQRFTVIETTPAPISRRIERQYDLEGRLLTRINGTDVEYDRRRDGSRVDYVKDERGLITRTERDVWRNVLKLTHPDGTSQQWEYHPTFNFMTRYTDELGVVSIYDYDSKGNPTRLRQAVGSPVERTTTFTYDQYGQLKTRTIKGLTPAEDATTEWTYDDNGNVTDIKDAEGHTKSMREFDAIGNAGQRINARGKTSERVYNAAGWLTESRTPMGFVTSMGYDKVGNRTTMTTPIDGTQTATTQFRYNPNNQLIETIDPLNGVSNQTYDEEGRLTESADQRQVKTTMAYDARGRLHTVTDGSGDVIETIYGDSSNALEGLVAARQYPTYREEYRYDERDRLVKSSQLLDTQTRYETHFGFDALSQQISQIDAKGRTAQKRYDELERLIVDVDADNYETKYQYDSRDNMTAVTDANGNTHRFTYDRINRKKTEARPLGQTIAYTYDPNGNLIERLSPNGAKRKFFYDDDDRLEREEHFMPNTSTPSKINLFTYDQRGLMLSYEDGLTRGVNEYNLKGEKTKETVTFGINSPEVFSKTLQRSYEANGLLKTLTYPDGGIQRYTYDNDNQLQTYKIPGLAAGNDTLTYTYRWNAIESVTMPGGLKRIVTLDPLQRPRRIEVKPLIGNGPPVMDHRYEYDPVSNINKKTTLDGNYVYGYDNLDRLTSAIPPESLQVSPANPDGLPVEGYRYDPVHNRIWSLHQPGEWVYNDNDALLSWGEENQSTGFEYDDNSTLISLNNEASQQSSRIYTREVGGNIRSASSATEMRAEYGYDPQGRRILKRTPDRTTWYLYTEFGLLAEYSIGGLHREFGWTIDSIGGSSAVWQKHANDVWLIHVDALPSWVAKTRADNAEVVARILSQSFGNDEGGGGGSSSTTEFGFPGQWSDAESGLVQNGFRNYLPSIGRYVEIDPAYRLDGTSGFPYVSQNPNIYFDALGLAEECAGTCKAELPDSPHFEVALTCYGEATRSCAESDQEIRAITDSVYNRINHPDKFKRNSWCASLGNAKDVVACVFKWTSKGIYREAVQYVAYEGELYNKGKLPEELDEEECRVLKKCIDSAVLSSAAQAYSYTTFNQSNVDGRTKVCAHYFQED